MGKHALIFGASGITGWPIVNELSSDSAEARLFDRVTALTVRPFSIKGSLWPSSSKLKIYSGIDLSRLSQEETLQELKNQVSDIDGVTHVFFNSYKWVKEHKEESIVNSSMLEKAVVAVEALSPVFEYLVLPTGTKAYGIHLPGNFIFGDQLPLRESLPRIPEPHASEMFYYWETDALTRLSEGKKWTWCEVRPDLVVGFVPNDNSHCLAQTLGIYLSLYRHVRGEGSEVPWPGTTKSYNVLSSQTSQDIMARFSIWASLNPEKTGGGEAFNVIDSNQASTWAERWSLICSLFGLKGVAFREDAMKPSDFMEKHRAEWDEVATIHGLRSGLLDNKVANPFFFDNILSFFDYDHQISADKIYKTGFTESWDEKKSWSLAFERFRKINVLP